jgi:hypothetical protein
MKNKIIFYIFIIGSVVGYYFFRKQRNKILKNEIETLIKKASKYSSESEKIINHTLKFEKSALGKAYLDIITESFKKNKIESLTKLNFDKFQKNINKNFKNSRDSLHQKCNLKQNSSYLEDISNNV